MKTIKGFFKITGAVVLALLAVVTIAGLLFMNLSPQFGGSPSSDKILSYSRSNQYQEGIFVNTIPTAMDMGISATVKIA